MSSKRRRDGSIDESQRPAKSKRASEESNSDDDIISGIPAFDLSQNPGFQTVPENGSVLGIIEKVNLKNFMCHSNLTYKVGPKVNFLIGNNGSGKSAILTAMIVGLGGKASATNRGTSMKNFIKKGAHHADITITLSNRGPHAYKPKEYGDSITIHRRIGHQTSTYRVLSHSGAVISHKRDNLVRILDVLNVQIDNPVCVLTQDASRSFLSSSKPQDHYKFFMKATLLELLHTNYDRLTNAMTELRSILTRKKRCLPIMKQEVLSWEKKSKSFTTLDQLKERIRQLECEMAWSIVIAKEKELERVVRNLAKLNKSTHKYLEKIQESEDSVAKALMYIEKIEDALKKFEDDLRQLQPKYEELKGIMEEKKKIWNAVQTEQKLKDNRIKSVQRDRTQVLQRLDALKNCASEQQTRQQQEEKLQDLQNQLEELKGAEKNGQLQVQQGQLAVRQLEDELSQLSESKTPLTRRLGKIRENLNTLSSSQDNRLKRFGNYMVDLVAAVDKAFQQGRFSEKPRGPIGALITLKDQRWSLAMECCLGQLLQAFCVSTHNDRKELQALMERHCGHDKQPPIITSKFHHMLFDVSYHKAQTNEFPIVLQVLNIEDPVVANTLIDQRSIENIILIPSTEMARQVMLNSPPTKCREAFTPEGHQLFPDPDFRFYSASKANAKNLLATDVESSIRNLKKEKAQIEQQLGQIDQTVTAKTQDLRRNREQLKRWEGEHSRYIGQINNINYQIGELMAYKAPSQSDIAVMEEELQRTDDQLAPLKAEKAGLQTRVDSANEIYQKAVSNFQELEADITEKKRKQVQLKEKLVGLKTDHTKHVEFKTYYVGKYDEHLGNIAELQKDEEQKSTELQNFTVEAEKVSERVDTRRIDSNIRKEIDQIRIQIEVEEQVKGDKHEVQHTYLTMKKTFDEFEAAVGEFEDLERKFKYNLDLRCRAYEIFKQAIANNTNLNFEKFLKQRNFEGRISFDHKTESLTLKIQTGAESTAVTDLSSLSGGERSFATVTFILALWSTVFSPFRMLDEFDVFMDMVNRKIAMDLMLQAAKENGYQYIFLSPQTLSIEKKDYISVYRLTAPDRTGRQSITEDTT